MTSTLSTPLETLAQQIARHQSELQALRREYETRQSSLSELTRQKEALQAQLQQLDAAIEATIQGGHPSSTPAARSTPVSKPSAATTKAPLGKATLPARKPFRKNSLPALLLDIFAKAGGPLGVKQLAAEVVRRKYPTTSSNVPAMVDTRVRELAKRGLIQRAADQSGFVLASAGTKNPAGKSTPAPKVSLKNGAAAIPAASPHTNGQPPSLRTILADLLSKSRRPLTARELAEQVLASGYQTKSKNFVNVLWVALGQMNNVVNVSGKGYKLKR